MKHVTIYTTGGSNPIGDFLRNVVGGEMVVGEVTDEPIQVTVSGVDLVWTKKRGNARDGTQEDMLTNAYFGGKGKDSVTFSLQGPVLNGATKVHPIHYNIIGLKWRNNRYEQIGSCIVAIGLQRKHGVYTPADLDGQSGYIDKAFIEKSKLLTLDANLPGPYNQPCSTNLRLLTRANDTIPWEDGVSIETSGFVTFQPSQCNFYSVWDVTAAYGSLSKQHIDELSTHLNPRSNNGAGQEGFLRAGELNMSFLAFATPGTSLAGCQSRHVDPETFVSLVEMSVLVCTFDTRRYFSDKSIKKACRRRALHTLAWTLLSMEGVSGVYNEEFLDDASSGWSKFHTNGDCDDMSHATYELFMSLKTPNVVSALKSSLETPGFVESRVRAFEAPHETILDDGDSASTESTRLLRLCFEIIDLIHTAYDTMVLASGFADPKRANPLADRDLSSHCSEFIGHSYAMIHVSEAACIPSYNHEKALGIKTGYGHDSDIVKGWQIMECTAEFAPYGHTYEGSMDLCSEVDELCFDGLIELQRNKKLCDDGNKMVLAAPHYARISDGMPSSYITVATISTHRHSYGVTSKKSGSPVAIMDPWNADHPLTFPGGDRRTIGCLVTDFLSGDFGLWEVDNKQSMASLLDPLRLDPLKLPSDGMLPAIDQGACSHRKDLKDLRLELPIDVPLFNSVLVPFEACPKFFDDHPRLNPDLYGCRIIKLWHGSFLAVGSRAKIARAIEMQVRMGERVMYYTI